jgi:peptide chain release factor subunit 1
MEIKQTLRELARFSGTDLPVVSVYLDTQWRDQHQRERVTTFMKHHIGLARSIEVEDQAWMDSLHQDLIRIENWYPTLLRRNLESGSAGVALFACSAADLWLELPVAIPFTDELTVAPYPALRQLAGLDEDNANVLVVMVDSQAARVCEVVLGDILSETPFTSDFPGRHKQGGWAQMRYQRHVKEHMDRHHKEVADYLNSYLERQPDWQIILSGQETIVSNFRRFLSSSAQNQIIDTLQLDMQDSAATVLQVANDVIQRHEREEEADNVKLLLNRAGQGGLAVVGIQETVAAVNDGRVHKLIMNRDFNAPGYYCAPCGVLDDREISACSLCGARVEAVELGEALVSGTLRTDGFVELIEPNDALAPYEGVGALLRYK